ncbi:MAG: wax ester/triacylglycerol synthase family O-acyltransferase [Actinobacteria bacterium]|nr:wax ester/triacylglycerol synthase family O-acyltransferase [Actinomycetota bacterium]
MDRMSPLDASFLHIEDGVSHMHIGSVAIFEGPPPPYEAFRDMVAGKLPLVPRYRQKVRFVPLQLGRPLWVDDPHFNAGYHLRHTALPRPGGDDQLRNLVGRLMAQQLDRSKPLWEMWMVEGLDDSHWAIVSKVHHCLVDGVSGSDLLAVVLDAEPDPAPPATDDWKPEPEPSDVRVVTEALGDLVVSPYEQFRALRATTRGWRQLAAMAGEVFRGAASFAGAVRPTVPSTLNGPIGPHRRWDWARTTLADVKTVRKGLGGTVNDVVLTVLTKGFRDFLLGRGESVDDRVVRTLVPVSVRTETERGTYNNRVSAMIAELPVGIADPVERLEAIRAQMDGLKESKQAVAGEVLTSLAGFAPATLLALGARVARGIPQRNVNTVTTNVPGPQLQLYAAGRPMLEAFPFVPIAGHVRVGIAIFSYNGMLNYGVTGDYDSAPDIGVLCRGIEDGMSELLKLVSDSQPEPGGGAPNGHGRPVAPGAGASTRAPGE